MHSVQGVLSCLKTGIMFWWGYHIHFRSSSKGTLGAKHQFVNKTSKTNKLFIKEFHVPGNMEFLFGSKATNTSRTPNISNHITFP